jgi:hypothetical protein
MSANESESVMEAEDPMVQAQRAAMAAGLSLEFTPNLGDLDPAHPLLKKLSFELPEFLRLASPIERIDEVCVRVLLVFFPLLSICCRCVCV